MAQKIIVNLVDDIDGSEAESTTTFAFDGVQYEIDLNEKNRAKLEKALGVYVDKARRIGRVGAQPSGRGRRSTASSTSSNGAKNTTGVDPKVLREWATANGFTVSDRGRVSGEIQAAYAAAH